MKSLLSKEPPTIFLETAALTQGTRGRTLYAFDEKIAIDVAKVKSDLRRDGGSGPVETTESCLEFIQLMSHKVTEPFVHEI